MGRRTVRLDQPDRWVFNRLARAYRTRPPYPDALVERLLGIAGGAGARIADLGAGTGLLAVPLAESGADVTAVDPAQEMLSVLRERVRPTFADRLEAIQGTAESTGLPAGTFDLVLLADALHWVDPELAGEEAARLLRAGGGVAVVEAAFAPTPFMSGLAELLARANPKARPRPPGALRQLLSLAVTARGGDPDLRTERFVHEWPLDDDALAALLRSLSHIGPALGPARLEGLIEDAVRLARSSGGSSWSRVLTLTWATRRVAHA